MLSIIADLLVFGGRALSYLFQDIFECSLNQTTQWMKLAWYWSGLELCRGCVPLWRRYSHWVDDVCLMLCSNHTGHGWTYRKWLTWLPRCGCSWSASCRSRSPDLLTEDGEDQTRFTCHIAVYKQTKMSFFYVVKPQSALDHDTCGFDLGLGHTWSRSQHTWTWQSCPCAPSSSPCSSWLRPHASRSTSIMLHIDSSNHDTCGYRIESIMIKMNLIKTHVDLIMTYVDLIMIHTDSIMTNMDRFH